MVKVLVETISTFRHRYAVETDSVENAENAVWNYTVEEFSQMHLGEVVIGSRIIDDAEYLRVFNEDNDYLSTWTDEQKFRLINILNKDNKL